MNSVDKRRLHSVLANAEAILKRCDSGDFIPSNVLANAVAIDMRRLMDNEEPVAVMKVNYTHFMHGIKH